MSELKPVVFNYRHYTKTLEELNRLKEENKRLRRDKANLEIRLRIVEADNDKDNR